MTRVLELAPGTALMAVLALACLGMAWVAPWFHYDSSSGRQTAPDGAYNQGQDGTVRHHLTVYSDHWTGDVAPSDPALAKQVTQLAPAGLATTGVLLVLAALGEVPFLHRWIGRRVCLVLLGLAFAALATTALLSWLWLPHTVDGYGLQSQFGARLDEPKGYSSTTFDWGWYVTASALVPLVGSVLFKLQAGVVDLEAVSARFQAKGDAQ